MPIETPSAPLEFLLVSSEPSARETVESAIKEIGGAIECATSLAAARELIKSHKVDGVILDADIKFALDLIAIMRRSKNARAFAFVCVNNEAESAVALKCGANALLNRPLTVEAIVSGVGSFKSIIASERRRYERHDVTLPAVINLGENTYQGIVENISRGGIAIQLPCLLPAASHVEFSFELETGEAIQGTAQLRWSNPQGLTGMEFRSLAAESQNALLLWLRKQYELSSTKHHLTTLV